jgi:hypothetical protein
MRASAVAHFITAPLLVAAALSLAGVVGGADTHFRWPGPTLLLLVFTALTLLASIQLSYHARQYLYSYQDLSDWYSKEYVDWNDKHEKEVYRLRPQQEKHFKHWQTLNKPAVHCYNTGTVLLGLGLAAALVPPDDGKQAMWRWVAAALVTVAALAEIAWIAHMYKQDIRSSRGADHDA